MQSNSGLASQSIAGRCVQENPDHIVDGTGLINLRDDVLVRQYVLVQILKICSAHTRGTVG